MKILGFEWLRNVLRVAPCAAVSQPGLQSPPAPGHLHLVMDFVLARRHLEGVTRAEQALGPWPSPSCWLEAAHDQEAVGALVRHLFSVQPGKTTESFVVL